MNVLFLSTHLNTGGITSYLATLAKGLVHQGHQVTLATSGGDMEKEFLSIGAQCVKLDIRTKSELSPKIYKALNPLTRLINKNHIDVIHAQTRVTQVIGRLLQRRSRCPYLSTCHGFFQKRLSRRLAPCWGDTVIAISQPVYEHLHHDFGVSREKIALIESGIDIQAYPLIDEERRRASRQKMSLDDRPMIGIIARLSDVKGQDILIQAMENVVAQMPEAKLLIFGQGKMEGMLKTMVDELHLQENVLFYPNVNQTAESLASLDVFAMPSRQEGLGLSVMEAQASGLPVVASNIGGIPSLIESGKTGVLVDPESIEQLAQALVEVLRNREHSKKMGKAGRKFIEGNYSAERMVQKTLSLYKGLLGKQ